MAVGRNDVRLGPLVLGHVVSAGSTGRTCNLLWPYGRPVPNLLAARSRVVLAITPEAPELAALQHRNTWVQAVRFTACFERVPAFAYRGTVGKTTFFPFGIALREPTALPPAGAVDRRPFRSHSPAGPDRPTHMLRMRWRYVLVASLLGSLALAPIATAKLRLEFNREAAEAR